jgi:hypothetical protein
MSIDASAAGAAALNRFDDRVLVLLERMTLGEKIGQMSQRTARAAPYRTSCVRRCRPVKSARY